MKKVLIYPFTNEATYLVRNIENFTNYKISHLVTIKGNGLSGHFDGYSSNMNGGYLVTDDYCSALPECDLVILVEYKNSNSDWILDAINYAAKLSKDIVCAFETDLSIRNKIERIANRYNINTTFLSETFVENFEYLEQQFTLKSMYDPHSMIICVGGLMNNLDQENICLSFALEAKLKGFKVSILGCGTAFILLGFHDYSGFLKHSGFSYPQRIKAINSLLYKIDTFEKPDIIIIQVPGEIARFNNVLSGDFSMNYHIISESVNINSLICSLPFGEYTDSFFNAFSDYTEKKFGSTTDVFHISNRMLLYDDSMELGEFVSFFYNFDKASEAIHRMKVELDNCVFNVHNSLQAKAAYETIISKFN